MDFGENRHFGHLWPTMAVITSKLIKNPHKSHHITCWDVLHRAWSVPYVWDVMYKINYIFSWLLGNLQFLAPFCQWKADPLKPPIIMQTPILLLLQCLGVGQASNMILHVVDRCCSPRITTVLMEYEIIENLMKIRGCRLTQTPSVYVTGEFSPCPKLIVYIPFDIKMSDTVIPDVYDTLRMSCQGFWEMVPFLTWYRGNKTWKTR